MGEEVVYNDDVCKEPKSKIGLIVGLSIGGIIVALIALISYCRSLSFLEAHASWWWRFFSFEA